jgi:hypothetical protein
MLSFTHILCQMLFCICCHLLTVNILYFAVKQKVGDSRKLIELWLMDGFYSKSVLLISLSTEWQYMAMLPPTHLWWQFFTHEADSVEPAGAAESSSSPLKSHLLHRTCCSHPPPLLAGKYAFLSLIVCILHTYAW